MSIHWTPVLQYQVVRLHQRAPSTNIRSVAVVFLLRFGLGSLSFIPSLVMFATCIACARGRGFFRVLGHVRPFLALFVTEEALAAR